MRRLRRFAAFLTVLGLFLTNGLRTSAEAQIIYRCASKTGRQCVALTFDDGPHPKYTPLILDILKAEGVQATFFTVGTNAETYPDLIKRIAAEGHELGNHTYNHNHVGKMSRQALAEDISLCAESIARITGSYPRYFRPPEGVCNQDVKEICEKSGMTIVMWSVDTKDWAHPTIFEICENVRCNTKTGAIVLMHDFIGKNSPTPEALRQIIPILRGLGYEFVTVSQLLSEGGVT